MFRDNRIGTPVIHTNDGVSNTGGFTCQDVIATSANIGGNVINASAISEFGSTILHWAGTVADGVANGSNWSIGQWFTVAKPPVGNAVGIALGASLRIDCPNATPIRPVLCKVQANPSSLLSAIAAADGYQQIAEPDNPVIYDTNISVRSHFYKTQVVIHGDDIEGSYFHGFLMGNNTGAEWNPTIIQCSAFIRQLTDQTDIRYLDLRR